MSDAVLVVLVAHTSVASMPCRSNSTSSIGAWIM